MSAPDTEVSEPFIARMRNRMALSYYKYGPVAEGFPEKISALGNLSKPKERVTGLEDLGTLGLCLRKFQETGNTEYLSDAANYLMIESMHPAHPNAHFRALCSSGSAKRMWQQSDFDGTIEISQRGNDLSPNND